MNNKVFCVSDNDSGWFPAMYANDKNWQRNTGFHPAEPPQKPETPLTAEAAPAEKLKKKTKT